MMSRAEHSRARSGVPRDRYLWLLAAILGVATVHAITSTVHDTTQRRAAAMLVARSVAEQVTAAASARLEAGALIALAPAVRMTTTDVPMGQGGRVVAELRREYLASVQCRCRDMVPAVALFRFDIGDGSLDWAGAGDSLAVPPADLRPALAAIARAESEVAGAGGPIPAHLWTHGALGKWAAVTAIPRNASGHPTSVVGLVAERHALIGWAFAGPTRRGSDVPNGNETLARLDSLSLEVRDAEGRVVLGALDPAARIRAVMAPRGVLEGLKVEVALAAHQIATPLIAPIASRQLWHLLVLMLATLLMIVLAVRSSRREAQLARARSDFVAAVSHELRMPLAQILLASETLTLHRERDAAQRQTLASSIVREARRLIALVENVLLFSRTGAVELRPNLMPVPVEELFSDVVEAVALAAEEADQAIASSAPPGLSVIGDQGLLRQAMVNLVDNAMKYGAAGQRIRLIAESSQPGRVRLIVEDEGRGVPHADRARVFEPYRRLDRDLASERTGTGLGLAVVREIVQACHGRVWLEETAAGGTRAVIELPSAAAVADGRPAVVR